MLRVSRMYTAKKKKSTQRECMCSFIKNMTKYQLGLVTKLLKDFSSAWMMENPKREKDCSERLREGKDH